MKPRRVIVGRGQYQCFEPRDRPRDVPFEGALGSRAGAARKRLLSSYSYTRTSASRREWRRAAVLRSLAGLALDMLA